MVAAQWGETRDPDARTGGGVSGRFRPLGGSVEAPDTTPPPFGTAPWGYRRSEVDAWASWVAGLVAHGRNETVRADSAEATLKATLARLEQLERTPASDGAAADRPLPTRPARDGSDAPGAPETPETPETASRTSGRLHFDPPADLPRRTARAAPTEQETEQKQETHADGSGARDTGAPADPPPDHDLARLHVVESTLHEVLELLHRLAGRTQT